jgi:GNAT superfamily N-acetyltransferase
MIIHHRPTTGMRAIAAVGALSGVTGVEHRGQTCLAGRVQGVGQKRDGSEATAIFRVAEAEIGRDLRQQVQALLQACFPGYPSRSYFKLPPHFRYLAMASGVLVAQMGVELRVIRVGGTVLRTFGVVDLCVRTSEQAHGLAARLLAEVTELARSCGVDFVVLFADDDRLYTRGGWARAANPCSWVKIHDHTTLGAGYSGGHWLLDGEKDWATGVAYRRGGPAGPPVLT